MSVCSKVIEGDRKNGRLEHTRGDAFVGTCLHETTGKMDRRVFFGDARKALRSGAAGAPRSGSSSA